MPNQTGQGNCHVSKMIIDISRDLVNRQELRLRTYANESKSSRYGIRRAEGWRYVIKEAMIAESVLNKESMAKSRRWSKN
jgi:hypothetical protein